MLIKQSLETPLYWKGTEIKTPCDLSIGLNMCKDEMIEMKSKKFPATQEQLSQLLKDTYESLTGDRNNSSDNSLACSGTS